jgi:hypothetical protein
MRVYNLKQTELLQLENILMDLVRRVNKIESFKMGQAYLCVALSNISYEDGVYSPIRHSMRWLIRNEIISMIDIDRSSFTFYLKEKTGVFPTATQANIFRLELLAKWLKQVRKQIRKNRKESV